MKRLICIASVLAFSTPAYAWDSRGQRDVEGQEAARQRMIGNNKNDEHRQIWLTTLLLAGAPSDADSDMTLTTFTASDQSYQPVSFLSAAHVQPRVHSPSEFAQLPDFSHSLWDWALGNETCPLGANVDLVSCHAFTGHMGAVNSSHFAPQTATNYKRYHQLAMARATQCAGIRTSIGMRDDLKPFLHACVQEALTLEAIGHHFLQDAWSMGHMWQRWGSPDLADFAAFNQARVVGAISGLIHGARGVLQSLAPAGVDVNDALCAPNPDDMFVTGAGRSEGVGDLYLQTLTDLSGGSLSAQHRGLFGCTVGGLRAVLAEAGEMLGSAGVTPIDPSQNVAACFGQRATNAAMVAAYAINFSAGGISFAPTLEELAAGVTVLIGGVNPLTVPVTVQLQLDILRVGAVTRLRAFADPNGTQIAQGGAGTLFGVEPNASFDKLGPYTDPALPWPAPVSTADSHELALARVFHAAHAKDWCDRFRAGDPELDLERLKDRAKNSSGAAQEAACGVCGTFVSRHLRIGDPATYMPTPQTDPLCERIATNPGAVQHVYQADPNQSGDRNALALAYCGCKRTIVGNVTVTTQADVNALAGTSSITGTLSFPFHESATDPITSLAPLASLVSVGGDLQIFRAGFKTLTALTMPALAHVVGELLITSSFIRTSTGGSLTSVSLPALTSLGGRFNVGNGDPGFRPPIPDHVSVPALIVRTPFRVFMADGLRSLTVGGVDTTTMLGDAGPLSCPDLQTLDLGQLTILRDLDIGPGLMSLTAISGHGTVGRDVLIQQTALTPAAIGVFERALTIGRNAVPDDR